MSTGIVIQEWLHYVRFHRIRRKPLQTGPSPERELKKVKEEEQKILILYY